METLVEYIRDTFGLDIKLQKVHENELSNLPFYIRKAFQFVYGNLLDQPLLLLGSIEDQEPNILQIVKQLQTIKETLNKTPVIVIKDISAITRKRLIQRTINFIVPGKQLFLPALLFQASDRLRKEKKPTKSLLPSAQVMFLYRILKRYEGFDNLSMKEIADRLKYTGAAISKAADNLQQHNLCELKGTKEKYIHFRQPVSELWHHALPFLTNPVIKMVYVDILPKNVFLMKSNTSALSGYSEVSESKQQFRAIERNTYYDLEKKRAFLNANPYEGDYCLEVWKYDPTILVGDATKNPNVDPLSLYLSLKDHRDERIGQALEKIIADHVLVD